MVKAGKWERRGGSYVVVSAKVEESTKTGTEFCLSDVIGLLGHSRCKASIAIRALVHKGTVTALPDRGAAKWYSTEDEVICRYVSLCRGLTPETVVVDDTCGWLTVVEYGIKYKCHFLKLEDRIREAYRLGLVERGIASENASKAYPSFVYRIPMTLEELKSMILQKHNVLRKEANDARTDSN
jgi:hypothetical protein